MKCPAHTLHHALWTYGRSAVIKPCNAASERSQGSYQEVAGKARDNTRLLLCSCVIPPCRDKQIVGQQVSRTGYPNVFVFCLFVLIYCYNSSP